MLILLLLISIINSIAYGQDYSSTHIKEHYFVAQIEPNSGTFEKLPFTRSTPFVSECVALLLNKGELLTALQNDTLLLRDSLIIFDASLSCKPKMPIFLL